METNTKHSTNKQFIEKLHQSQGEKTLFPPQKTVCAFLDDLLGILFPALREDRILTKSELENKLEELEGQLVNLIKLSNSTANPKDIAHSFFDHLPVLHESLLSDAKTIEAGDPAAQSMDEVIRTYPGFYAICIYRIAHTLYVKKVPFLPRIFTEIAHSKTGIDIHPGAIIGKSFFIDHGTGVVIGETSHIGNHVKIYQGVTLGALSVKKDLADYKRHPSIEDHVVIYAGATILGGETRIGRHSTIGGNVWITESVEPHSMVYHKAEIVIKKLK